MGLSGTSAVGLAVLVSVAVLAGCNGDDDEQVEGTGTAQAEIEAPPASGAPELARSPGGPQVETVAEGLESPWEIAFLPDGRAIVTERPGRVRLLERDLTLREEPIAEMQEVEEFGEAGLLGAGVDPRFAANRFVYFYRSTARQNEVVRYRFEEDRLVDQTVIADGISLEAFHDGGRLHFGPDGYLYFSTGDAGNEESAQDPRSLSGKILRLSPRQYRGDGGRPQVFSHGHRNPQGFDWQPRSGQMVASEHGDEGNDEVNILRRGPITAGRTSWERTTATSRRRWRCTRRQSHLRARRS
jgi:glucose/arabinose dehydrogenase